MFKCAFQFIMALFGISPRLALHSTVAFRRVCINIIITTANEIHISTVTNAAIRLAIKGCIDAPHDRAAARNTPTARTA